MNNLILFLNAFFSYLLLFILIIALVVIASVLGAKWRKSKDKKLADAQDDALEQSVSGSENA